MQKLFGQGDIDSHRYQDSAYESKQLTYIFLLATFAITNVLKKHTVSVAREKLKINIAASSNHRGSSLKGVTF